MGEDNVVRFDPDRKPPIRIKQQDKACPHKHVLVDRHTRSLECADCGATVDPFDWVLDWAMGNARHELYRQQIKREVEREKEVLEELKKFEANARARIKRLGEHAPPHWQLEMELGQRPGNKFAGHVKCAHVDQPKSSKGYVIWVKTP